MVTVSQQLSQLWHRNAAASTTSILSNKAHKAHDNLSQQATMATEAPTRVTAPNNSHRPPTINTAQSKAPAAPPMSAAPWKMVTDSRNNGQWFTSLNNGHNRPRNNHTATRNANNPETVRAFSTDHVYPDNKKGPTLIIAIPTMLTALNNSLRHQQFSVPNTCHRQPSNAFRPQHQSQMIY